MGGREGWGEKGELVLSCYQIAITDASRHRRHRSNPRSFCRSHAEGEGDRSPRNRTLPSCRLITPPKSPALRISMDAGTDSDKGTPPPAMALHPYNRSCVFSALDAKSSSKHFFFFSSPTIGEIVKLSFYLSLASCFIFGVF